MLKKLQEDENRMKFLVLKQEQLRLENITLKTDLQLRDNEIDNFKG